MTGMRQGPSAPARHARQGGFTRDGYVLTDRQAAAWHDCRRAPCTAHPMTARAIIDAHSQPGGMTFSVTGDTPGGCHVTGPGLAGPDRADLRTRYLFAAISGWPLTDCADR